MIGPVRFGTAQAFSEINGIINADTTWTKTNSPYTLTGPVAVNTGVTLTIEPGVTVNLGAFYMQVNGTLVAKGTSTDKIYFNSANGSPNWAIAFNSNSANWNEQTGSGSIIQNTVIATPSTGISIDGVTPKIDSNSITGSYAIGIYNGSPVISNNVITGNIGAFPASGSPTLIGNNIKGNIYAGPGSIISKNTISGSGNEIGIYCLGATISDNNIIGFQEAISTSSYISTIERNLIINNEIGIQVGAPNVDYTFSQMPPTQYDFQVTIQNNLITNNSEGISVTDLPLNVQIAHFKATIVNNNILNNFNYNFYLAATPISITAANNWWGTTDQQTISQTIHDYKNDFNVGNVTFVPFLTSPNSQAPSSNIILPTQSALPSPYYSPSPSYSTSPSGNPTTSPQQSVAQPTNPFGANWVEILVIGLLVVIAVLLGAIVLLLRKRK